MPSITHTRLRASALTSAFVAVLASASPALADSTYSARLACEVPGVGTSLVTATFSSNAPATWPVRTKTQPWSLDGTVVTLVSEDGGSLRDGWATTLRNAKAVRVEGYAGLATSFAFPTGNLDVDVPISVPSTTVPATGGLTFVLASKFPALTFKDPGTGELLLNSLTFSLKAYKADGSRIVRLGTWPDPEAPTPEWDLEVPCQPAEGERRKLLDLEITPLTPTPTPTETPTPSAPATPTPSAPATPTPSAPPTATPTPTPKPPIKYGYNLAGSATLKTLTKGTLPLTGTVDAELTLATGAFSANLGLSPTSGNLVALGFLPVSAKVQLVPLVPATGTLTDAGLTAKTQVRIKLPEVKALGIVLAGGANCQAKNPSQIALKSGASFDPLEGGTLTGTFAISDLTGCGFLNGLVSPLTSGSGNAIALKLTKK